MEVEFAAHDRLPDIGWNLSADPYRPVLLSRASPIRSIYECQVWSSLGKLYSQSEKDIAGITLNTSVVSCTGAEV